MIADFFTVLSVLAIVAGGLLMAFSAHKPTWLTSWVSAYLVLIVGIIQLGFIVGWRDLREPKTALALLAFMAYNIGNLCVVLGTVLKERTKHYFTVVSSGSVLLAVAMILLLTAVHSAQSSWTLTGLVVLTTVILISMPIGVVLSNRHRKIKTAD